VGHVHAPPVQLAGAPHRLPQVPQLRMSVCGLTHAPAQLVWGVQSRTHVPPRQNRFAPAQTEPHAPQFCGFVVRSTQVPPQRVVPAGQPHVPFKHSWPTVQALPQAPQFLGSLTGFTHAPLQLVSVPHGLGGGPPSGAVPASLPGMAMGEHAPLKHTLTAVLQAVVQEPQWAGSEPRLVQTPFGPGGQKTSPGWQVGGVPPSGTGPASNGGGTVTSATGEGMTSTMFPSGPMIWPASFSEKPSGSPPSVGTRPSGERPSAKASREPSKSNTVAVLLPHP
jgi:hypothetical protein